MGKNSKIEWTDHTFNPWWGCVKVSPGCKNCYAEARQYGGDWWGADKPRRFFGEKHWKQPLKWNADAEKKGVRYRVFCGSYCDVFEENDKLNFERGVLWNTIGQTKSLDWLLLTKRPENITSMVKGYWLHEGLPDNVWLGISVENQEMADKRIPELLKIPARVRFLSCEPLLEEVELPLYYFSNIDWVIVGGESGPKKRPFNPDWARSIREQCKYYGIPFFMKQIDKVQPIPDDLMIREFPK